MKKIRANAEGDCGDKKNICGQVTRELVPGTLQLFYMKGYGRGGGGVHRFHPDTKAEEGKFIDLWRFREGTWKITRILGYGHRAK